MKDKRLLILNMLNEGKISSQEALDLLEALKDDKDFDEAGQDSSNEDYYDKKEKESTNTFVKKSAQAVGSILGKLNIFMDNFQDKLSEEFDNSKDNFDEKYDESPIIEESYSVDEIIDNKMDFTFNNPYGAINLFGHDENKVLVKILVKCKKSYESKLNNFYKYNISNRSFELVLKNNISHSRENFRIDLDIKIPKDKINALFVKSLNDHIDINNIVASELEIENINSYTQVNNISIHKLNAKLLNGNYLQKSALANDITIKALNSNIKIDELKSANVKITNPNGPIHIGTIDLVCKNLSISAFNSLISIDKISLERPIILNNTSKNAYKRINPNLNIINDINKDNMDIFILNIKANNGKIEIC